MNRLRQIRKLHLTVGIPAYNEENNIARILREIPLQNSTNYILKKIIVYSDGSTDSTNKIVNRLANKNKLIKLVISRPQKGKIHGLNYIFEHMDKQDQLILIDADMHLGSNNIFQNMITMLDQDQNAQVISAHQTPIRPDNFFGRIIYAMFTMWDYVRWSIPNYNHVQNLYGAATLIRGSLARTMHIPEGSGDERVYIYLRANALNGFRYCKAVNLRYTIVTSFQDYLSLMTRKFGTPVPALEKEFGKVANTIHKVPRKYVIRGVLISFIKQPFYTPIALVLAYIVGNIKPKSTTVKSDIWQRARTGS